MAVSPRREETEMMEGLEKRCVQLSTTDALHLGIQTDQSIYSYQEEIPLWGKGTSQPLYSPVTLCCTSCFREGKRASRIEYSAQTGQVGATHAISRPSALSTVEGQ